MSEGLRSGDELCADEGSGVGGGGTGGGGTGGGGGAPVIDAGAEGNPVEEGGCGCRLPAGGTSSPWGGVALLVVGLAWSRRRRSPRSASQRR